MTRIVADDVPLILWVVDPQGELAFANRLFRQFFGLDPEAADPLELIWPRILHREDLEGFQQRLVAGACAGGDSQMECRVRRGDGEWRWMQVALAPYQIGDKAGDRPGLVGAMQDISARREAEAALRRSRDQLREHAQRLGRLTLQLTLGEQQERQRISRLLHDHLQQDMVAVKFQLKRLEGHPALADEEALQRATALIDQAITTGRTLHADIHPPLLHQGSFAGALAWLARTFRVKHGLRVGLRVGIDLCLAREDVRVLLFESVRELLLNVVKHAGVGEARVGLDIESPRHLLLRVEDSGRGFGACAPDTGLGLGLLAISERMTVLGGLMIIASGPGLIGTRVSLRVPLTDASGKQSSRCLAAPVEEFPSDRHGNARAPLRILLADDQVMVRQALASLLNDEADLQVVGEASDGFEAMELVARLLPDVVVMDFSMPELDGPAATRMIRSRWSQVRVIGLSVREDHGWVEEMLDAGASDAISKAEVSEVLLDCLRGLA